MSSVFNLSTLRTLAEILILWFLFYQVLRSVQGTRAAHVLNFLILVVLLTYLSRVATLETVYWLLERSLLPLFMAVVVLYAPELRRAISSLAQMRFLPQSRRGKDTVTAEIVKASQILSQRNVGALIVFERGTSLQGFVDTGIALDALVSAELLVTIFSRNTPLHDGAVILRNDVVAAASCLLPLTERLEVDKELGTRHRAALGLSEETDAIVVVVSEETGTISVAVNGSMTRDLDAPILERVLNNLIHEV
ncbi:MAG TPA: diadenylate cyclase CdaA [bacterium]|jgi:diadenylate cyclase|nr:diadenylate cyclase CdaA [bacterium]HQL64159.1 diadenylate cyclase CdaA [bacterium]